MDLNDSQFNERPQESIRIHALKYINKLIDKANSDEDNNREDIRELLHIQELINRKKYGLVWEDHEEKVDKEMESNIPVFVENSSKKITGVDGVNKYNFLLVGDNLHSLHLLEKTHYKKVNVIYIDPPYNTGNKDFKYNDNFVDSSDEYIHSKWISFMHRRLELAKEILTDDGVILISIDNNEYANLKLLMDQLFPTGYVTTIHVEMSTVQGMKVKSAKKGNVVKNGEYILVYSKDGHKNVMKTPLYNVTNYDNHYNQFLIEKSGYYDCVSINSVLQEHPDIVGQLETLELVKKGHKLSNSKIGLYYDSSTLVRKFINDNSDCVVRDHTSIHVENGYKYDEKKVYLYEGSEREYLIQKNEDGKFTQKIQFSNKLGYSDDFKPKYGPLKIRGDWWKDFYLDMGNVNKEGGVKLENGKKPVRLIKQLLKATTDKNDTIVDFFAGSGTTGQAVIELNKEDGGNREFILSTNNEGDIADKITYQRMVNINEGYKKYKPNPLNLKYFNTEFINKDDDDLESSLLKNIKTLVELTNEIDIENSRIKIITKRNQVSNVDLKDVTTVYMRGRVHKMMSPYEQERYANYNINIIDIPENFFSIEMQGWL